ncbi:MAG: ABC transporter ATP-binding protein [Armatimonadetes bacterium]|nr:ABC transporter ATP-binding protein [Armatimonadota bacterium]
MPRNRKLAQSDLPDRVAITPGEDVDGGLRERVQSLLEGDERLLLVAESDLGPEGTFGRQWLVVTSSQLMVFGPDAEGDGAPRTVISLKDVEGSTVEMLVGRAVLQVTMDGQPVDVIGYTQTHAAAFGKLSRALDDWTKSEKEIDIERLVKPAEDEKVCEKCGRILPPWSSNCPACVPRGQIIRRLFTYLKPYWCVALFALLVSFGSAGLELVPPTLMRRLIDKVINVPATAGSPTSVERLALLAQILVLLVLVRIGATLLTMTHGYVMVWLGGRITFDVRSQLYNAMQHLAMKFFDKKETGGLMSRITRDSDYIQHMVAEGAEVIVRDGLLVLGIATMLFVTDWRLAIYVMIPAPIIVLATSFFWRRVRRMYHRLWHRWSKLFSRINEAISGVRVVKAFAQEEREVDSVNERAFDLFRASVRTDRIWSIYFPAIGLVIAATQLLIWWIGGQRIVAATGFTLGQLMQFFFYVGMFYGPLQSLTRLNDWMQRAFTAAERVFEIIDTEPEEYEKPGAVVVPKIKGHVNVQDVTFGYDKAVPVLQHITLDVQPGEMIGLVGHSGAGKSTLINLICRFYDVDDGTIEIDAVDVKNMRLTDLRSQIGAVLQEPFLFNGGIAENIAYGKPTATPEEIIRAARAANAHEFIIRMPDGYDTVVGERGARLSGGERQRISIARAILHDPAILILDEATASVDTETEQQIQEAIGRLITGRTTFAIAHRLSTLRNAHRLLVLEHGKVAELGTHDELLEARGTYHKLVELQRQVSAIKVVDG